MEFISNNIHSFSGKLVMLETVLDIMICLILFWIAAVAGLLIGWSWRPQWATVVLLVLKGRSKLVWTAPPGFGARRIWFALTALSALTLVKKIRRRSKVSKCLAERISETSNGVVQESASSSDAEDEQPRVTEADLETLLSYIDEKDGGPPWQLMMDQSTATLAYQAWRRDLEDGPMQYRTRTIIENTTPELVRDFFWDDEFRMKWDDTLAYFNTLQECPRTGTTIVHWIRKFPFFCSDREYIIIRRIWQSGSTYYCVTKSTPYPALSRHRKLRRVDLYYSSWRIKAVASRNGDRSLTASEVLLFHHEEMGIPKEIVKIGIQTGMWGQVKKMDAGLRAYQISRAAGSSPPRYAFMTHITTKLPEPSGSSQSRLESDGVEERDLQDEPYQRSKQRKNMFKWLAIGGVVVVCGLNGGTIGKGIMLGIARGFGRIQKRKESRM